jgi:hypothetical protein
MELMKDEVVIDGKTYISASRAAKISGYNSDYIGQLCRKGILDSRMVGRLWFVCEDSLKSYKKNPLPVNRSGSVSPTSPATPSVPIFTESYNLPEAANTMKLLTPARELAFMSPAQNFSPISASDLRSGVQTGDVFFNKIVAGFVAIMLFVAVSSFVVSNPNVIGQNFGGDVVENKVLVAQTLSTGVETATVVVNKFIEALSNGKTRVVELSGFGSSEIKTLLGVNSDSQNSLNGVVVLPSSGVAQVNDQVKEYVRKSFSDEVVVEVDDTGDSGFIKPVFKNSSDEEYMYVMVPLKE